MSNGRRYGDDDDDFDERITALEDDAQDARTNEMKQAFKEAITEWLDEKFSHVGKWTIRGLLAAGLAALAYMMFVTHSFKVPP